MIVRMLPCHCTTLESESPRLLRRGGLITATTNTTATITFTVSWHLDVRNPDTACLLLLLLTSTG